MLEHAIIGTVLTWPEELHVLTDELLPAHFANDKARAVFSAMIEHSTTDAVILAERAGVKVSELSDWQDHAEVSAFLPRRVLELKENHRARQLVNMANEIRAHAREMKPADLIEMAERKLAEIHQEDRIDDATMKELVKHSMVCYEARYNSRGELQGLPTGIPDLDEETTGGRPGELWIVAGRPSMGKTALALNICEAVTLAGHQAMMFSMEMPKQTVLDRIFASQGRISLGRIRSGRFHDGDWSRISSSAARIAALSLTIDDRPGVGMGYIKRRARKAKRKGLDVVVVDYLQIMDLPRANQTAEALGEITKGLKILARELNVWVILLSQNNRESEKRDRPSMSDLKGSGSIEQDADTIIFPYRESATCNRCLAKEKGHYEAHERAAEIIIGKQRNGPRNVQIPVVWFGEFQRFEPMGGGD